MFRASPPWLERVLCPFLVREVEPNTQSVFVPGFVIFVSGQLPGGCKVVLEFGEPGEPVLVEFLLPTGGLPPGEAAQ